MNDHLDVIITFKIQEKAEKNNNPKKQDYITYCSTIKRTNTTVAKHLDLLSYAL
jgi:hypothetical protein